MLLLLLLALLQMMTVVVVVDHYYYLQWHVLGFAVVVENMNSSVVTAGVERPKQIYK